MYHFLSGYTAKVTDQPTNWSQGSPLTASLTASLTETLTASLTHCLTHSLPHSLTAHSLTGSLTTRCPSSFPLSLLAQVAGTERGVTEPEATFSACFGAAFLTLHPTRCVAAEMRWSSVTAEKEKDLYVTIALCRYI